MLIIYLSQNWYWLKGVDMLKLLKLKMEIKIRTISGSLSIEMMKISIKPFGLRLKSCKILNSTLSQSMKINI